MNLNNTQSVTKLSFDYKLTSDGYMNVALLPDWSNYFGYFELDANGEVGDYAGVTVQQIENGYMRVFIDLDEVTSMHGTPSDVITMLYVRGAYTTANGIIENIRLNSSAYEPLRGTALTPGVNQQIDLDTTKNIATVSFEYKLTGGNKFAMALLPDWSSYFGYYDFYATGLSGNYPGVTTEVLEDGYIRVTMNLAELTAKSGDPSYAIDFLYLRGSYSDASGYIDNVTYTEMAEPEVVVRGEEFKAGVQYYYYTECTDNMSQISFDYKITNDGFMDIYIGNDNGRYGNFYLYANGEQTDYAGIITEALEDGYIRVTFQLDVLSGSTGAPITYVRLRSTTTATGYFDNLQWNAIRGTQFSAGANSYVYTEFTDALSQFVFEYKVTNDGVMDVLIGNGNGQYGNFYFDANGAVTSLTDKTAKNYDGVSVEVLNDGYIRVTFQLNELTTVYRGTPGNVVEYVRIRSTTTAAGYVDDLQLIA